MVQAAFFAANLQGADLAQVRFAEAHFDGVHADEATVWPEGFNEMDHDLFPKAD
ncbi:MAG: pentapeptide repeat-containing protein [Chloroflexi bacterium]|nr:pentapeptide repeat-containing protein [Chloroflexota bacterium]